MTSTLDFLKIKLKKAYDVLDEIKENYEDWTLLFKLGEWVTQHAVLTVCT
jgi:hypothetical protein